MAREVLQIFRLFTGKKLCPGIFMLLLVAAAAMTVAGCAESEEPVTKTETESTPVPEHKRMQVDFYKGVTEPRSDDMQNLILDAERILGDGFNTVAVEPPVLITARAGGNPRVILEGEAISTDSLIDALHEKGLAVHLAPTTASPGFQEKVDPDELTYNRLIEEAVAWAETAETRQVELYSPLSRANKVLGTDAAGRWLKDALPQVRASYSGPIAAKVVADIDTAPAAGGRHDFEMLDYDGYDFLMLDITPLDETYNEEDFTDYTSSVMERAEAIVERDQLKGLIIGDLRLERIDQYDSSTDQMIPGETSQAKTTDKVLELVKPRVDGVFFYGWSHVNSGARGFWVEDILIKHFKTATDTGTDGEVPAPAGDTTESTTVVNSG
jgi:hypothetical protein